MLRLIGRRRGETSPVGGTDDIVVGISLPSETVIHDIRFRGECVPDGSGAELNSNVVMTYALEAWILPVDDPDSAPTYNSLWDILVPKDSDVQVLDLDEAGADTPVFYEPGETDWQALFNVGRRPKRLWHHHADISMNTTRGLRWIDPVTPFEPKWQPGAVYRFHDRRRYVVDQPSVLVFGAGIPSHDDTVVADEAALAENEWPRVKYMGDTMKMALMDVLGLTEAGATVPWAEATDLLQKHLDPDTFETDAAFWTSAGLRFTGELTLDHSVVGDLTVGTISTGR